MLGGDGAGCVAEGGDDSVLALEGEFELLAVGVVGLDDFDAVEAALDSI